MGDASNISELHTVVIAFLRSSGIGKLIPGWNN